MILSPRIYELIAPRLYVLFCISLVCYGVSFIFYDRASADDLTELAKSADSLKSPAFNHALRDSLSDGKITNFEFYKLSAMADRIQIEMQKEQAEMKLNKIADTSK